MSQQQQERALEHCANKVAVAEPVQGLVVEPVGTEGQVDQDVLRQERRETETLR